MINKRINLSGFALFSVLAIAVLALSACSPAGGNIPITGPTSTPAPLPTSTPEPTLAPAAGEPASVAVSENEEYGQFLVDGQGMTLYLFTKDEPGKSNCSGECLANWPPLLTSGDPVAAEGVDASLLGAADLADGSQIVTYNGHPLYYWIGDKQPGDTSGQNVGEVWFVVSPAGEMIAEMEAAATEEPAAAGSGQATLMVGENAELGQFLVDGQGKTLYLFTKDEPNKSNCAGDCLVNWPPFLTDGDPVAGEGVDASLVGTAELDDGSTIVTYDGHPLYYWKNDQKPGDTTGQNVGEVWFVVPVQPE